MQGARWTAPALLALTVAGVAPSAHAFRFDLGGIQAAWENRVVLGATMRLDERNDRLIGKLNVNPDLCPDDCISFSGNPAPNQRLVDAPGAFLGANFDNGNLNYDQYDLTAAQLRLESELKGSWGKVDFKISGVGFYDAVNYDFDAFHPDTALQPRHTPRPDNIEAQVGLNFHLLEAFVSVPFDVFDQKFYLSVGEQRIRWGQSTFVALGSLDVINPPDQNRLRFPGAQIASVFEPVGLVVLTTRLSANLQAEMLYQYHWQPVTPSASGSFFSVNDIAGGGEYAVISLGQFSEDSPPYGIGFKGATPRLITSTPTSVPVDHFSGQPDDGGTYGLRLNYYAAHLNGGTNLGFYALNYSSRLPYASAYATDKSCLRDIPPILSPPDLGPLQGLVDAINDVPGLPSLSANGVGALLACTGFNGTLNPTGLGEEPLPIDTLDLFLEYPEDIHMFGIAFTTNMGHWSLAGEYVYHPNLPLQVSL
ncbi:MAG: DUF1302 domain-containing protein, partial [Salinisphaera sp.]|nr:DUF1302 domain-containing protein [Salinisphaera sp.]